MRLRAKLILCLLALALPAAAWAAAELRYFRIGTAATTGTYFQVGGALANAISDPPGSRPCAQGGSCGVPGLIAVAQSTQGSIANVLAVGSGELESALAQSDVSYWAYSGSLTTTRRCRGDEPPPGATGTGLLKSRGLMPGLRAIAGLYPEKIHIVARADGPLQRVADLRGKRIALGERESGTLADARLVLEEAGFSECEVDGRYLKLSASVEALASGEIDAFFIVAGLPVPAVTDAAAEVAIRIVPIEPEVQARLTRKYPFFRADTITAGAYRNVDEEVPTVSVTSLWIVGAEVPDDLVYGVTKALWSDATRRLLESAHPVAKDIRLDTALAGLVLPLHPGAERFYREAGLTIPGDRP